MLVLLASIAFADPCERAVLSADLSAVENAYLKGDPTGLSDALKTMRRHQACEPLTPLLAHRVHLAEALEDAATGDWPAAEQHLVSAVAALPTRPLQGLLAEDARLRLAFYRAQERGLVWTRGPERRVNGQTLGVLPDVPVLSEGGDRRTPVLAIATGVLAAGLYGGAWLARDSYERVAGPNGEEATVKRRHAVTNGLALGALGSGVVSVGLFGIHLGRR